MRSGLISIVKPDLIMADDFTLKAVETHDTAIGFAVANNGVILHEWFDPEEDDLLSAVTKTQEKYKSSQLYFHFQKAGAGEIDFQSIQPFPILKGKDDQTLLAMMLEGEFLTFAKEGPSTPEFNIAAEYLTEKIRDIYKEAGSLEKAILKLDSPTFRKDLQPHLMPRGTILLIPGRGKPVIISTNNQQRDYSWGFASKNLGIEPTKEETNPPPATVAIAKKIGLKAQLAAAKGGKPTSVPNVTPAVANAPSTGVQPETKEAPPLTRQSAFFINEKQGKVLWCKPAEGTTLSAAKQFWNKNAGIARPSDAAEIYAGFPVTALAMNSPLFAFLNEDEKNNNSAFRTAMAKAEASKAARAAAITDTEVPGLLTAAEKLKAVGARKNSALWDLTPEQIAAQIEPKKFYSEQVQIDLNTLAHADPKFYMLLGHRELVCLTHEFRMKVLELWAEKAKTPITPADKKVEAVASPASPGKKLSLKELQRKAAA